MGFQCPQCSHLKSLRITSSIELALDARSDEISLQVLHCKLLVSGSRTAAAMTQRNAHLVAVARHLAMALILAETKIQGMVMIPMPILKLLPLLMVK